MSNESAFDYMFHFGKYNNCSIMYVMNHNISYLHWCLANETFSKELKDKIEIALKIKNKKIHPKGLQISKTEALKFIKNNFCNYLIFLQLNFKDIYSNLLDVAKIRFTPKITEQEFFFKFCIFTPKKQNSNNN